MTDVGSAEIMSIMANTTNKIAEGEVLQLMHCNNPEVSEEEYLKVIYYKTAMLLELHALFLRFFQIKLRQ